ncbi:MAG: hypothetical protein OHK0015_31820 [Chloroflexi bacterium OHK40]
MGQGEAKAVVVEELEQLTLGQPAQLHDHALDLFDGPSLAGGLLLTRHSRHAFILAIPVGARYSTMLSISKLKHFGKREWAGCWMVPREPARPAYVGGAIPGQ